jgi:hypothetical protein
MHRKACRWHGFNAARTWRGTVTPAHRIEQNRGIPLEISPRQPTPSSFETNMSASR